MTASSTAPSRPALAGLTMPPWLWVWLILLLSDIPVVITSMHSALATLLAPFPVADDAGFTTAVLFSFIFAVLVVAILTAGAVGVAFPQLRGRWVEWRYKLASDDRPVVAEMQRFVDSHDPSIRLRVSIRGDQMARIYPVGWRSARIAVFRPLSVLWRHDREAAQAILLHEVAHRRQGDQLIVGLGGPFVWLVRIGVPAYLLFVLIPAAVAHLTAGDGTLAVDGGGTLAVEATLFASLAGLIPYVLLLPVIALWLTELNADQQAAHAAGSAALERALRAPANPRPSLAGQAIALLSHPPRRLRLRRAAARPAGTVALIVAWPAALVAFMVLPIAIDVPSFLHADLSSSISVLKESVHVTLVQYMPVIIATAAVLLAYPGLAASWQRLWSSAPRLGRHQPWWPYLATASLPLGMLLLSLATPVHCPPVTSWMLAGGWTNSGNVLVEYEGLQLAAEYPDQFSLAGDNKTVMAADATQLDATIQAALANPPPGAAGPSYRQAMIDYRTAAQELLRGDTLAAQQSANDAISSYKEANTLITNDYNRQGVTSC